MALRIAIGYYERSLLIAMAGVVQWQNVSFPKWTMLVFSITYRNSKEPKRIVENQEQ
jgi:hypothetical protein